MQAQPGEAADPAVKNFVVGVQMTEKELQGAFERNGLKKIQPAKGEKFDPHKHQAMMELAETDVAPGAIVEVMQAGYELLGRLVRPAMVVVAAKGANAGPKGDGAANPYAANEDGDDGSGGSVDTRA
jgi:molecular chaperone GrpE